MLCQIPVEEAIRFSSDYGIADVKKMDFDIYINEDGSVKVKQLIEVSSNEHEIPVNLFDMDNYFFHLSRTEEEEIEEKMDLKIVDVVTRKSFDRI